MPYRLLMNNASSHGTSSARGKNDWPADSYLLSKPDTSTRSAAFGAVGRHPRHVISTFSRVSPPWALLWVGILTLAF